MSQERTFRILSLSGGGIRGIFQAVFLSRVSEHLGVPLWQCFDLIAGTSTGAILGLAIALGIEPATIAELYRIQGPKIFKAGLFAGLRRRPRYSQERLQRELEALFGSRALRDCRTSVIVTATSLESFTHRTFEHLATRPSADDGVLAYEVALASSAAPTFFAPTRLSGRERAYVDGGLWANAPAAIALLAASSQLGINSQDVSLLSVGTGYFPNSQTLERAMRIRPVSLDALRMVFDMVFTSQVSASKGLVGWLLQPQQVLTVDAHLPRAIPLDDAKSALEILPALAEAEAEQHAEAFKQRFAPRVTKRAAILSTQELAPREAITAAGLTALYPSREYYHQFRAHAASIDRYVATAQATLVMVSINLLTGVAFDDLRGILRERIVDATHPLEVTISLLDPSLRHLLETIAPNLGNEPEGLAASIRDALRALTMLREGLGSDASRLRLRLHGSLPFASAILIDHHLPTGRIQVETKPYRAPMNASLALEFAPGAPSGLYESLVRSYDQLVADGRDPEPSDLNPRTR